MKTRSRVTELIFRILGSKRMMKFSNLALQDKRRLEAENIRIQEDRPHFVKYFHSVSDPYSYLALQKIEELKKVYNIRLECFLVGEPPLLTTPEPEIYKTYSLQDAKRIASFYNIKPPILESLPHQEKIRKIERVLAVTDQDKFIKKSLELGHELWLDKNNDLEIQAQELSASEEKTTLVINKGNSLRSDMKHYLGAVFNYEGENYWGIDRLKFLENRLTDLGLKRIDGPLVSERNTRKELLPKNTNTDGLTIEFYPSLNSPYTYISFSRIKELSKKYSCDLIIKPVLPMLMRGMKIPGSKGLYILNDASREGREIGVEINKIYTPIGRPAERAYSLFEWVNNQEKGFEYLHKLMIASFHDGKRIYNKRFLKQLINELGLNWEDAKKHLDNNQWQPLLEKNRLDMYKISIWGVPAFNLKSKDKLDFSVWGQDRLWLLEEEILNRV